MEWSRWQFAKATSSGRQSTAEECLIHSTGALLYTSMKGSYTKQLVRNHSQATQHRCL